MTPVTARAGQHLALFGLGGSGLVTAEALLAGGAAVTAWDDGEVARRAAGAAGLPVADLREADWAAFAALVLSPGVPLTHPAPHWAAAMAHAHGVPVIGDIELFCDERAHRAPDAPFIAITGTNGKSTTTALTAHLFRTAGWDVQMGGNIGVPALELEPPAEGRLHVLELSSFQIDLAPGLKPTLGILTNLTPDHIDRHGTMAHYAAVKERLVSAALWSLVGVDDAPGRAIHARAAERERRAEHLGVRIGRHYAVSVRGPVEAGVALEGSRLVMHAYHGDTRALGDLAGLGRLRGLHNAQNAAFACGAADIFELWRAEPGPRRSTPSPTEPPSTRASGPAQEEGEGGAKGLPSVDRHAPPTFSDGPASTPPHAEPAARPPRRSTPSPTEPPSTRDLAAPAQDEGEGGAKGLSSVDRHDPPTFAGGPASTPPHAEPAARPPRRSTPSPTEPPSTRGLTAPAQDEGEGGGRELSSVDRHGSPTFSGGPDSTPPHAEPAAEPPRRSTPSPTEPPSTRASGPAQDEGGGKGVIQRGLDSFPGLPHRMEQVGQRGRVLFVNDSKATNADAAAQSLAAYRDVHWIAGGVAKAGGIAPLAPLFGHLAKVYLIGEAAEAFAATLAGHAPAERCGTLARAVAAAARDAAASAAPEPVVLLAPACASYDQFKNFEQRGDSFRAYVSALPDA